jgi:predicted secreted protein
MGEEITVRLVQAGQEFAIDLEAMPGAGYMWEITQQPEELELKSQSVVSISPEIGGNSTQRFVFLVEKPGTYSLSFQLKRRWEQQPARTSLYSIRAA